MDPRLTQADALLKSGKAREAANLLITVLTEAPDQPANVYRVMLLQLHSQHRYQETADWSEKAVARFPKDFSIWNIRGVALRRLTRYDEAIKALDQAQRLDPKSIAPAINKGNIYNDQSNGPAAEAIWTRLVRMDPRNAEYQRGLARALISQKKWDQAITRCRQAVNLKKDYVDAWLDWSSSELNRLDVAAALEVAEKSVAAVPGDPRLLEAKSLILARTGNHAAADEFLVSLLPQHGHQAWLQNAIGTTVADRDRRRANEHLQRAVELEPNNLDYRVNLIESLERSRHGDEGANIEAAFKLLEETLDLKLGKYTAKHTKVLNEVCIRVCAFDRLNEVGTFHDLGRSWAETGRHTALLKHLARVETPQDRYELMAQHKLWGDLCQEGVDRSPVRRPKGSRSAGGKIRIGLMSSDLRAHPVGYFAFPLFEAIDRDRFEVFVYSYYTGQEDAVQKYFATQATAYRWWPDISAHDAAQKIADDDLDMLIELGGSTHMNKLEVMAWRPARLQASWLGYPHSAGLSRIDHIVLDPNLVPEDPALLLEKPMLMPKTWLSLGRRAFTDAHRIAEGLPQDRAGCISYGTANNPHKYSESVLRTWARVVRETPGSRFIFVRPEGGTASFRANVERYFGLEGVTPDRIVFRAVRGAHMPHYNEIDITLDPFPLTGGTTTCEALWMGVPVINLRGAALFERLSGSILTNVGLATHITTDLDAYVAAAVALADDHAQRRDLRHTLRDRLKASPLGQNEQFARDFYDLVERTVTASESPKAPD